MVTTNQRPAARFWRWALALSLAVVAGCVPPSKVEMPVQPTVAFITDFGERDAYVAEMKGVLLTINPGARVMDLLHQVDVFNIRQAAYLVEQASREFPPGTIFVCVVDPGVGSKRDPIALQTKSGKFFVGPDNGIFSWVLEKEEIQKIVRLENPAYFRGGKLSSTFHGRDIFTPVAAHLSMGVPIANLGKSLSSIEKTLPPLPKAAGTSIIGEIIHIDGFGNLITNIPRDYSPKLKEGTLLRITVGANANFTAPVVGTYSEMPAGRSVAIYNSQDMLEIAVNRGSAEKTLKATVGMPVTLKP